MYTSALCVTQENPVRVLIVVLLTLSTAMCGQKGPLTLPESATADLARIFFVP